MPTPSPSPQGARLSRRAALAALAGVVGVALSGCTEQEKTQRPQSAPDPIVPPVDPDVLVAAEALASQREILDLLAATRKRHRALAARLAPAVDAHEAHADLLADAVPKGVSASAPPSPSPQGPSHRQAVPRSRARALARVVEAEQQLATSTKRQAFRAQSGAFARLLGSMAAAAAQNAAALAAGSGSSS